MKKVYAIMRTNIDRIENDMVHYDGVPLIGSSTLCGHTDRVGWQFKTTNKTVNCVGCIAVRDHVLGKA